MCYNTRMDFIYGETATTADYVRLIDSARVYDVARVTSLDRMRRLSDALGANVCLKREDTQEVHSFKIRGAYNKMCRLPKDDLARGVLAASAGNHAQGVALSAKMLGTCATIVMPETTPRLKIDEVESYGARIVLKGETYSDAAEEAKRLVAEKGLTFIPPYDDPEVIAGQGTVAKEILEQCPSVGSVFVPIGGGGFAAGVSVYVKGVKPSVKVYGVEPDDSDCMAKSIEAGRPVTVERPGLFADGVCVKRPGDETFRICRACLDGIVRVSVSETCKAMEDVFAATRTVCEPAGALALAALKKTVKRGETAAAIVSGANMNFISLCFVSSDSLLARIKDDILADGRIDVDEARRVLKMIDVSFTPTEPCSRLIGLLRESVSFGAVTAEQSRNIARAIDETINLSMTTAEERRMLMG